MYVTDFHENKKVPTCNSISESSFIDSRDVKRAIELAPGDIAESYKSQAEQIEAIRVEWVKKASREPAYDVFISYKDSDREHHIERTDDSYDAHELYMALTEAGYKVFFSRVSLRDKVSEHYEPYIYNAIKTAKVMIVFGEKPEYFNAVWIKNEWMRFRKRIELGEKHQNSLVVAYKGLDPADLPIGLRSRQCIDASSITFLEDLKKHIDKIIRKPEKAAAAVKVDEPAATVEVPEKKKSKKGIIIAAIAAVLAVCIGVGFIVTNLADGGGETTPVTPHETEISSLPTDKETVSETESDPNLTNPENLSYMELREIMYVNVEDSYCFIVDGSQHYLEYGEEVLRIGVSSESIWSKIEYNGLKGYVRSEYLTYDKPVVETQGSETVTETETETETETATETETQTETETETETETQTETETETETENDYELKYMLNEDKNSYSVTGIGECKATDIAIPKKYKGLPVTSIGNYAFENCTRLTSVVIPDSVTSIGSNAFFSCDSLTSVVIGDSVTSIGDSAFRTCDSLTSVVIPDSVTSIGRYAFENCTSLTSVVIPDSVTSIGSSAFEDCTSLTSVVIPNSVTSIGRYAFYGCTRLTSVTFKNPNGWWYSSSSTATSGTSISSSSLANASRAARYLTDTYDSYFWKRS